MIVILDTSVLYNNYYLSGPVFSVIQWAIKHREIQLIIPQIVIEELRNHYRKDILKAKGMADRASNHLERLTNTKINFGISEKYLEDNYSHYEQILAERLDELEVTIAPYGKIKHNKIVARALARKRPFHGSGKGYRDTLIWETIVSLAREIEEDIVFITNNSKDFCEKAESGDLVLHEDFSHDLDGSKSEVNILTKLSDLTNLSILPKMNKLNEIKEKIASNTYEHFSASDWLRDNKNEVADSLEYEKASFARCFATDIYDIHNLSIHSIDYIEDFNVRDVLELSSSELLIALHCDCDITFSFNTYDPDFYDQVNLMLPCDASDFEDGYFTSLTCQTTFPITIGVAFNVEDNTIEYFSAEFDECFGWCKHCLHPIKHDSSEVCEKCGKSL